MGSIDHPFNPLALALGADATFVARTMDRDVKHMQAMLIRTNQHKGTSFLEIYQNCNIFNDGAFTKLTDKETQADSVLEVEHGKPMRFGKDRSKGIVLDGRLHPQVVDVATVGEDTLLVHDETNELCALVLSRLGGDGLPTPIGVLKSIQKPSYEAMLCDQVERAVQKGRGSVQSLLDEDSWVVG